MWTKTCSCGRAFPNFCSLSAHPSSVEGGVAVCPLAQMAKNQTIAEVSIRYFMGFFIFSVKFFANLQRKSDVDK